MSASAYTFDPDVPADVRRLIEDRSAGPGELYVADDLCLFVYRLLIQGSRHVSVMRRTVVW